MEENNIEQAETDTRKNSQLLGKVVGVTVPPKYTMALALAGLGRYYYRGGTSFLPTAIGGLIGYVLGSKFTIDPNEQKNTYREMIANSAILNQNKQGSAPASIAVPYMEDEDPSEIVIKLLSKNGGCSVR